MSRIAALVLVSLYFLSLKAQGTRFKPIWDNLTTEVRQILESNRIVGAGLYFVKDDRILDSLNFGYADLVLKEKVNSHTIFHWASITKTFTGIGIMQARDRGHLRLTDPIVQHLPGLKKVYNPFGPMDQITVSHLLSHSAGFRAGTWPWGGDEAWHPYEPSSWTQLESMLPYTRILFPPGSKFSYSNPGVTFLGRVLEQLYGEDIEVYLNKQILMPLDMRESYFDLTPAYLLSQRSNNYSWLRDSLYFNGKDFDTGITVGNGGLNSSISDMVRYIQYLLTPSSGNGRYVLSASSLQEMWTPVLTTDEGKSWIGKIFFNEKRTIAGQEQVFIGHTGSQKGFRSFFYIHPATHTGVIFSMNTDIWIDRDGLGIDRSREILYQIRELIFNQAFAAFIP